MVKIPSKFHDPDPDLDPGDFQNLMDMSLSKDTSMVKKIHEDPISSFRVKLLTDKQISKQTNKGKNITSSAEVILLLIIIRHQISTTTQFFRIVISNRALCSIEHN